MKFGQILTSVYLAGCMTLSAPAWGAIVVDTGMPDPRQVPDYETIGYNDGDLFGYFVSTVNTITGLQGYFQSPGGSSAGVATLYDDDGGSPGSEIGSGEFYFHQVMGYDVYGPNDLSLSVEVGKGYWVGFRGAPLNLFYTAGNVPTPLERYGAIDYFTGQFARNDEREFGVRITGENAVVAGAVPEISTWAMLLIGFGAAGTAIRRRRAAEMARA